MSVKKFTEGSKKEEVKKDEILKPGDWVLRWSPDAPEEETGFALYTPKNFDPEEGGGPLGGLILAAVYFILENGDRDFPKELIAKANEISKEMRSKDKEEQSSSMKSPTNRTLN